MTTTAVSRPRSTPARRAVASRAPRHVVRVSPIRSDADLEAAQRRMESLWGAKPGTPAGDELDVLGALVSSYEAARHPIPDTGGVGTLRALIEGNGLSQADLPEIGNQSVVSQILHGRRQLNVRQIKALAARFGMPASAFIS